MPQPTGKYSDTLVFIILLYIQLQLGDVQVLVHFSHFSFKIQVVRSAQPCKASWLTFHGQNLLSCYYYYYYAIPPQTVTTKSEAHISTGHLYVLQGYSFPSVKQDDDALVYAHTSVSTLLGKNLPRGVDLDKALCIAMVIVLFNWISALLKHHSSNQISAPELTAEYIIVWIFYEYFSISDLILRYCCICLWTLPVLYIFQSTYLKDIVSRVSWLHTNSTLVKKSNSVWIFIFLPSIAINPPL